MVEHFYVLLILMCYAILKQYAFRAACKVEICNSTSGNVAFSCAGNLLSKKCSKLSLRPNTNCDGLNPLLFISVYLAQRAVFKVIT